MRDFLRGTFGKLLQILLLIIGSIFMLFGFTSCVFSGGGGKGVAVVVFYILGILCYCASYGIKYWLGTIYRHR
jgi:hypothetical protein